MYWQVYFHKTVVCAEQILIKVLQRAKELSRNNIDLFSSSSLKIFLNKKITTTDLTNNAAAFESFTKLDDYDIYSALKEWQYHPDKILSLLSKSIVNRTLFEVMLKDKPLNNSKLLNLRKNISEKYSLDEVEINYLFISGEITNSTYMLNDSEINILYKDKRVADLISSADKSTISALTKNVKKYFYCLPKDLYF